MAKLGATLLAATLLTACATTSPGPAQLADQGQQDIRFVVSPGDNLAGIAQRMTGDFKNWLKIAAANNIKNPRKLSAGAIITIPGEILKPRKTSKTKAAPEVVETRTAATRIAAEQQPNSRRSAPTSSGGKIFVHQPTAVPGPVSYTHLTLPTIPLV